MTLTGQRFDQAELADRLAAVCREASDNGGEAFEIVAALLTVYTAAVLEAEDDVGEIRRIITRTPDEMGAIIESFALGGARPRVVLL